MTTHSLPRGADDAAPSMLAPFRVRSFRFQWPADLATSWAFEMETLILGWYVLVQTDSVLMLTAFGSLQFLGTLVAPMFGVVADRVGRRRMLCVMRACYLALASLLMTLALSDLLTPWHVLGIALAMGVLRPSDLVMRNALIGDTVPADWLMKAMGLSRTTMDSARIAGALSGASLFAWLGIGPAYVVVVGFYLLSLLLTLGVAGPARAAEDEDIPGGRRRRSPWRELIDGLAYVWRTPEVLALMWLAFLVNLTAYPVTNGLLPYVARELYAVDQTGLGHLVAGYALGALAGSIGMALSGGGRRPGRLMLLCIPAWFLGNLLFAVQDGPLPGFVVLVGIGFLQSLAMVSMSVVLLRAAAEPFRGRVQGVRMLAVYGLPLGLLISGGLTEWLDFTLAVALLSAIGIAATIFVGIRWRAIIWG